MGRTGKVLDAISLIAKHTAFFLQTRHDKCPMSDSPHATVYYHAVRQHLVDPRDLKTTNTTGKNNLKKGAGELARAPMKSCFRQLFPIIGRYSGEMQMPVPRVSD